LLNEVLEAVRDQGNKETEIESLYAHVWTENEEALNWYTKRGFAKEGMMLNGYYRKLKPDTAWVLRRNITPSDLVPKVEKLRTGSGSEVQQAVGSRPDIKNMQAPGGSFQDRRPDREWNDLPDDVLSSTGNGGLGSNALLRARNGQESQASSRSSSRSEKPGKKRRAYPAAAFGDKVNP